MCALLLAIVLHLPQSDEPVRADYVVRGATLHDGTGEPGRIGDLAIRGDRIVAVGSFKVAGLPQVLDGKGLLVAPGFIDLHSHSDTALLQPATSANLSFLLQGVTSVVTGNCGSGPADIGKYYSDLERARPGTNVLHQIPHNSLRRDVMGNVDRVPTEDELRQMIERVERGMRDGAWGLSTGLIYNPGTYARTDELIALARAAGRHGGFYASHIRNEGTEVLQALDEALRIGREGQLRVHISHIKASGRQVWGKAAEVIALIESARKAGQEVTADQYPYTASATSLAATTVPPRFRSGENKDYLARFTDPEQAPLLRQGIADQLALRDPALIRIARYTPKPAWRGLRLTEIARRENREPVDLVMEIERSGGAAIVNFNMSEEDVRLLMKQSWVATASDGVSLVPTEDFLPHPRSYGTFPRKIGRYAIEEQLLPVAQAIRSATGLPADVLRLPERGYLKPGYFADVVVFDPATFRDRATFDKPHVYSTGVRWLFVNGKPTVVGGEFTGQRAGRPLRRVAK